MQAFTASLREFVRSSSTPSAVTVDVGLDVDNAVIGGGGDLLVRDALCRWARVSATRSVFEPEVLNAGVDRCTAVPGSGWALTEAKTICAETRENMHAPCVSSSDLVEVDEKGGAGAGRADGAVALMPRGDLAWYAKSNGSVGVATRGSSTVREVALPFALTSGTQIFPTEIGAWFFESGRVGSESSAGGVAFVRRADLAVQVPVLSVHLQSGASVTSGGNLMVVTQIAPSVGYHPNGVPLTHATESIRKHLSELAPTGERVGNEVELGQSDLLEVESSVDVMGDKWLLLRTGDHDRVLRRILRDGSASDELAVPLGIRISALISDGPVLWMVGAQRGEGVAFRIAAH